MRKFWSDTFGPQPNDLLQENSYIKYWIAIKYLAFMYSENKTWKNRPIVFEISFYRSYKLGIFVAFSEWTLAN